MQPVDTSLSGETATDRVLCVDIDGSLIASDLILESLLVLMRSQPWAVAKLPVWLLKGRAHMKSQLARLATPDVATLPYRKAVLSYLHEQRDQNRRLVLASAADESLARAIADHLGLFDDVIASDGTSNLKGVAKLKAIEDQFGQGGFDYLGDSWADLPIWKAAGWAIVVQPNQRLLRAIKAHQPNPLVLEPATGGFRPWLKMLRVHQWAKNLLIFVPLIAAHLIGDLHLVFAAVMGFFAFSFGASSVYIVNDLMDLPADRLHPTKRRRPLASSRISIGVGLITFPILLLASLAIGASLPAEFLQLLILYLISSSAYTFYFKKKLLVDVLCLAGLYTLRILAGGAATGIEISRWLMAFSMFFFLSLAFVKRFSEILTSTGDRKERIAGRGYRAADLDIIRTGGVTAGFVAVLVLCLYLNDPSSVQLYRHSRRLWLLCPLILYWLLRIWFLADRDQMHADPMVFALTDLRSVLCGVICAAIVIAAMA